MIKALLSLRRVTTSPELVYKELLNGRQDTNYIPILSFSQHALGQSQCSKLWAFPFSVSVYLPAIYIYNIDTVIQ